MKRIIRLTESDLAKIVKRVLKEQQTERGGDPVSNERGGDVDYWKIIASKLKANGWVEKVDPNKYQNIGYKACPYKCCTYMYKGNHNTGPNVFLNCGENPSTTDWKLTVYTNNNQRLKTFSPSVDGAKQALSYALSLG
jgi:hypothetical protein